MNFKNGFRSVIIRWTRIRCIGWQARLFNIEELTSNQIGEETWAIQRSKA